MTVWLHGLRPARWRRAAHVLATIAVLALAAMPTVSVAQTFAQATESDGPPTTTPATSSDASPQAGQADGKPAQPPARDDGRSGSEGGGDGGSDATAALPDAAVILDILRRIPGFPGRPATGTASDDGSPPIVIDGDGERPPPQPRLRSRVTQPVANVPFTPRPQPRADDAPPAIVGAASANVRPNEVIVVLADGATDATVFALARAFGLDGETLYTSALLGSRVVRFRIPDQRTPATVATQLAADARVRLAQPNYLYTAIGAAAETQQTESAVPQYAPEKLRLAEAHRNAVGKRVVVAVIDTAIDEKHPALDGAIDVAFDALNEGAFSPAFHGTAIAGILAARRSMTSVAPAADILAIRAFADDNGTQRSNSLAIVKALDFAVRRGARIVNMSFAGPRDALLEEAITRAVSDGVVIIAAAGNGGPNAAPAYPAAFEPVIAVSATGPDDAPFASANRGAYIAIAAPGVDIIAPAPGGAFDITSGTSMAAAHISGIAALMLERDPAMTPKDVRERLTATARKSNDSKDLIGAGIADAAAAVDIK